MKITILAPLVALGIAGSATAAVQILYEEQMAREEEKLILTSPIAGIKNSRWFDYRGDVNEAQKELSSDLRGASDVEDRRDAWEEYAHELKHERIDYIEDMAEKGYRQGIVVW
ncbi:MAG TPA: hypothetical protein VFS87_04835 [Qipengyuania sp.]|nr:hypothetical protein [Qipengyuania sp.]